MVTEKTTRMYLSLQKVVIGQGGKPKVLRRFGAGYAARHNAQRTFWHPVRWDRVGELMSCMAVVL